MRHGSSRLQKQQALFRYCGVHSSSRNLIDNAFIVAAGIVTKQGKHESIFAASGTVAGPSIAAGSKQNRHDITSKADLVCDQIAGTKNCEQASYAETSHESGTLNSVCHKCSRSTKRGPLQTSAGVDSGKRARVFHKSF